MADLKDLVQEINKQIRVEIPNINSGGCGVFALLMSKKLVELGFKPSIGIMLSKWGENSVEDKKRVINNVKNNQKVQAYEKRETSFAHCCVMVEGLTFDGKFLNDDFKDQWGSYPIAGEYTIEEMEVALKVGSWNDTYSRRRSNPTLRKVIRKSVKQTFHVEHKSA